MNLVDFSLNRPITIFMIFTATLILGLISLYNLPVELMPNVNLGRITITTYVRGGLPSEEVEKRISKPLEEALGDISHLKNILTISKEGESTVILEFEPETNMNYAALDVRERLAKVRNKLPREAERPIVIQYGYGEFPIIAVSFISGKFSPERLRKFVEAEIKEKILRIEGVARIETVGGREDKILIELDEKRMTALKVSLHEILEILGKSNLNLTGGKILLKGKKYLVRTLGEFKDIKEIENIGIKITPEGSIIRLKDIGRVKLSYLEPREMGRINLMPSVTLYIFKKSLSNTLKVCKKVEKTAKKLKKELKKDMDIIIPFNQGEFISKAINQLKISLLIGAFFAILVLLFFLRDFSAILILALSLPFSLFITFSCIYLTNLSLNIMSLAGLCLGAGMLLDSSIVVIENIFKYQEKKEEISEDEIRTGAKEVSLAIFASVSTTLIVFLPFIFLNKETQRLYSSLSLSIIFSLIGGLFISLSLVPLLTKILLRKKETIKTQFFSRIERFYKKSLDFVLNFRHLIIALSVVGIVSILFLGQRLEKEFIGLPQEDKFTVFVQLPTGTRIEVTNRIVKKVESFIEKFRQEGEIKNYTTHIEPYSAKIYVQLSSRKKRQKEVSQIINELRKKTKKLEPAFIYYEEPQEIESKEFIIEILGYDYKILKKLANQAASYLTTIKGLTDVKIRMREGGPQLDIVLDQEKLALWKLNTSWVATELHGKLRGLIPTRFHPKESFVVIGKKRTEEELPLSLFAKYVKEIEMITRLQEKYRKKFRDLENITFVTPQGKEVKLSQVADFKFSTAASEIWRKNKKRMVQVSANRGNLPLSKIAKKIIQLFKNINFPEGYTWRFGETYYKMLRNQKELRVAFLFALILVYLVLASLFENLTQPFIILTTVPLAGIGSVSLLYFRKEPVGIGVLIGAIMLAGIVVNNGIILVDYINRLRRKFSLRTAVIEAASLRLRPILMTTFTTIFPLIPLIIFKTDASSLWRPLASTVASGLLTSCILTLYVIPCLYLFLEKR
ncbi:MAG: efflux RND transporter permease subunit [Candidatus Omnitrophica bacterium]|nr:efflux RND transporter permease subunit [Candidatus Omnitrophota bacterium]